MKNRRCWKCTNFAEKQKGSPEQKRETQEVSGVNLNPIKERITNFCLTELEIWIYTWNSYSYRSLNSNHAQIKKIHSSETLDSSKYRAKQHRN